MLYTIGLGMKKIVVSFMNLTVQSCAYKKAETREDYRVLKIRQFY